MNENEKARIRAGIRSQNVRTGKPIEAGMPRFDDSAEVYNKIKEVVVSNLVEEEPEPELLPEEEDDLK